MRGFYIYIEKGHEMFDRLIDAICSKSEIQKSHNMAFVKWDGRFNIKESGSFKFEGDHSELVYSDDDEGFDSIFIDNNLEVEDEGDCTRYQMLLRYIKSYKIISKLEGL